MTTTTFSQYADHLKHSDLPFLGEIIYYSVPMRTSAEYEPFVKALSDAGFDDLIPRRPQDADTFRRACTAAQRKRVPVIGRATYENILIRDVRQAAGHVWKQIVIEEVDGQNKRLSYEPKLELEYDPDIDGIVPMWLTPEHETTRLAAQQIMNDFNDWKGQLTDHNIRKLITDVLATCNATETRASGGVYFVMESRMGRVRDLGKVLDITGVSGRGKVDLVTIPLIDDAKQREHIRNAFEDESVGEAQRMISEIEELLSGPEVSERKFIAMTKRMKELKDRANEYTQLLDDNLDGTQLRLQALETRMLDLFRHQK